MFDFCFALEGGGFCSLLLDIHDADRFVAPGVRTAFSAYMLKKPFLGIPRDAGIEAPAAAEEDVDEVHVDIVAHCATILLTYDCGAWSHLG